MTTPATQGTEVAEIVDAELVEVETPPSPVPAHVVPEAASAYRITRHTIIAEGELPPRADDEPSFTGKDITVPARVKERIDKRGARNTRINRDTTRARYEAWCEREGRIAQPTTTTANVAAYFGYLMERGKGKPGSPYVPYSPDSLLAYCTRIVTWYPKGQRPDGSLVREMIEDYRLEDYIPAGGEKEQSAGLTLKYLVRVLDKIDETTRIGRRDAAMLVVQYGMLYRSIEVTNLLVKHIRLAADGVWVWTAKSKTRRKGKGRWRFIRDREDLRVVARVKAWLADLRELREPTEHDQNPAGGEPAYQPNKPLFRALTSLGNLKRRLNAKVRGLFLSGRAVNEMVKKRAAAAGVAIINGLKVTSHSLRAGPLTDLTEAQVPRSERNEAGDWAPDSTLADDVYNRPDGTIDISKHDPLDAVPLFGRFKVQAAPAPT
ncbi:tyrosine-type recombinase/integrase [Streptomyces sp. Amel2xE9]|uniref:tyrosine-type recombinase/integrase n=1 Tax=unclassified Streptomyces TaxID=2593676 RepID=UPI0003A1478A|nr:tyrosine-type recombinase/integrase [Streptomyces sp. Amel2xE9]